MKLDLQFEVQDPNIKFKSNDMSFDLDFGVFQTVHSSEPYEGTYEVIPKTEQQTLKTSQKYMSKDVTVHEIPYAEVTNLANGITVTIGEEV